MRDPAVIQRGSEMASSSRPLAESQCGQGRRDLPRTRSGLSEVSLLEWRRRQQVDTCRRSEPSGGQQGRDATRVASDCGYDIGRADPRIREAVEARGQPGTRLRPRQALDVGKPRGDQNPIGGAQDEGVEKCQQGALKANRHRPYEAADYAVSQPDRQPKTGPPIQPPGGRLCRDAGGQRDCRHQSRVRDGGGGHAAADQRWKSDEGDSDAREDPWSRWRGPLPETAIREGPQPGYRRG